MLDYIATALTGIFVGGAAAYYGAKFTDQRKKQETRSEDRSKFTECEKQMPKLFNEFREDLMAHPLVREFILFNRSWVYNGDPNKRIFSYYFDDHEHLTEKVRILEGNGLVQDITFNDVPRFRLTDGFVKLLGKFGSTT